MMLPLLASLIMLHLIQAKYFLLETEERPERQVNAAIPSGGGGGNGDTVSPNTDGGGDKVPPNTEFQLLEYSIPPLSSFCQFLTQLSFWPIVHPRSLRCERFHTNQANFDQDKYEVDMVGGQRSGLHGGGHGG